VTDISAVVQLQETVLQATLGNPDPGGGTDVTLGASVDDVLSLAGQQLNAEGPAGDVLLFWDASAGKLTHLSLAPGLSITGTVLSVTAAGTGTVTSVNITPPAAGITASGGPITASGSITLTLADDLAAVEGLSTTGIVRRTGANTWSAGTQVNLASEVTGQLPIATGVSGLGTGIASALAVNIGSAGAPVLFGGAAGTPSSLTLTNAGGLPIAGVTGLSTSLAAKADLVGGVIPTSQIPSVALVEFLGAVASQAAMLALRGQPGDWAIRTDRATEWVIVANNGATLSDWYELPTGIAPVGSVNGQTGSVVIGTGDVGESGGNLYFTAARAIGAALTGFVSGAGTVSATDSLLQAIQKIVGNLAGRALSGAIGSSGLTMATARLLGRGAVGDGAVEEITLAGGLSIQSGSLVMTEGIVLTISNKGETAVVGNNYEEKAVDRACTVVGVTFELNPTTPSTSGSSQVMLYARRSGTRTNLLSANASLPVTTGIFTNVSGTLTGPLTLAAGESVGADLIQVGTGATGLKLTVYVRYS
jgi:hypothetical protein